MLSLVISLLNQVVNKFGNQSLVSHFCSLGFKTISCLHFQGRVSLFQKDFRY